MPSGRDKSKIVSLRKLDSGATQTRCVLVVGDSERYGYCESENEESEEAVVNARDEDEDSTPRSPRQNPKGLFRRSGHPNGRLRWTRRRSPPHRPRHRLPSRRGRTRTGTGMSRIRSMMWLRSTQDLGYSQ